MTKRKHDKTIAVIDEAPAIAPGRSRAPGKLDALKGLVERPEGASIAEMMVATGWQAHSVRGAISGALRKTRGIEVVSVVQDGERRYRVGGGA